jgi:hypothetical protein
MAEYGARHVITFRLALLARVNPRHGSRTIGRQGKLPSDATIASSFVRSSSVTRKFIRLRK